MSSESIAVTMIRSVSRRLPGGETETLVAGRTYMLPASEAKDLVERVEETTGLNDKGERVVTGKVTVAKLASSGDGQDAQPAAGAVADVTEEEGE